MSLTDPELEPMGGPVGTNGLDPACLWDHTTLSGLFDLGRRALLDQNGTFVYTHLQSYACGMEVLDYTMRCALPDGEAIETSTGDKLVGAYGLAEKWIENPLSSKERRWMTACLAQHLNGLLKSVPLMIDGDHPALEPQPGVDTSDYIVAEATMFGDFFSDMPSPLGPPPVYTCAEKHFVEACGGPLSSQYLEDRICGDSTYCGLTYLGPCNTTPQCTDGPNDFWVCDDGGGLVFQETIRSFLPVDAANVQYELCGDF